MSAAARGRFIVLEGGEGAGKSTHARGVADWLRARGREVVSTREPGGSPLAEAIRTLVLADWTEGMGPDTEALMMFAARAAHLRATILPALAAGHDVVCDRFTDASYAYQGAGRGLGAERISALEDWTQGDLRPDLVLLMDIDPEVGLARAKHRGNTNRFDSETVAFADRVRLAYLARAAQSPQRYAVIDAAQPKVTVAALLSSVLAERFP